MSVNEEGFPIAYGVVRDLSESGACLVTDLVLKQGRDLGLKVSLDRWGMLETESRVIWSGEGEGYQQALLGGVVHGVQFIGLPEAVRTRLKGLLRTGAFDLAPTTQAGAADRTPFQEMLEDLQSELDRLGSKVQPSGPESSQ